MPGAFFDNLNDVMGKFVGTICTFEKKPVMVKQAIPHETKNEGFQLLVSAGGRGKLIDLADPAFDYRDFNIGYANSDGYSLWWYRRPIKQWQQGLKSNQMNIVYTNKHMLVPAVKFGYSKPYIAMLENKYPSLDNCNKELTDGTAKMIAFHRDFALSWDNLHDDMILEYRGKQVGVNLNKKLTEFRLLPECKYLYEALEEAVS